MKLNEILPSTDKIEEGYLPADTLMILCMLADGRSDNISHRIILAKTADYLSCHPLTAERGREMSAVQVSRNWLDTVRNMPKKNLIELATTVLEIVEKATRTIQDAQYTDPQEELLAFLNKPGSDN